MLPKPFLIAKNNSKYSDHTKHKIGSAVVRRKRILSSGHNFLKKTHPFVKKFDQYKTIHAEIDALLKLRWLNTQDTSLYVYRETKDGRLAMARPCACCWKIIKMFGVKKVFYTTNNGWASEAVL